MEKSEVIPIKLNDNNYMNWSFHLKIFVKMHGLLDIIDGSYPMPVVSKTSDSKDSASATVKPIDESTLTT